MVENTKPGYYSGVILEGKDGNKYAINPFAISTDQIEVTVVCNPCNLTFENTTEYEHHIMEMHSQKKTLSCNICNTIFKRQDHLKRHIVSIHTNHKYTLCPVCRKDCERQDLLMKHIKKKHSVGAHIFHCRECPHQCNTLEELEQHECIHLLTERHLCPHCSTSFKRRDHMLRHVKSQHLNQFVVCPICSQTYKRKDHLVRHVREKHKMGYLNGKLVKSSDIL